VAGAGGGSRARLCPLTLRNGEVRGGGEGRRSRQAQGEKCGMQPWRALARRADNASLFIRNYRPARCCEGSPPGGRVFGVSHCGLCERNWRSSWHFHVAACAREIHCERNWMC